MENVRIAHCCALKTYIRLCIVFLFLFFPLMSCKGKSGEKPDADASQTKNITIENAVRDLETGDIETSKKAAAALGKSGNPEAMDALLVALEEDEDSGVRKAAALALGTLGEPDCTDRVVNALVEEDSTEVQDAICKSLQEFEGFSIEPILYLVRDNDKKIRERGVRYLVAIGDTVLEDVMDFVQEAGRITLHMNADELRGKYRTLNFTIKSNAAMYRRNAVGLCLGLYMDDRDQIETMKKTAKRHGYSIVDPYE
ncbi:MAG: HEAT repeat domain-containing protein [Deltaproteobacteria bacterium]|nr:HEAT repeat domain-containing protein [Deltaproteobacteria bacterium]MBW2118683.1 HEAT repeat domain-containing protein [Deltaproteobacteria bacterium]MBW2343313.1 HEAT repeat domain-containing protein [Deltaproteobacteria bacterium]